MQVQWLRPRMQPVEITLSGEEAEELLQWLDSVLRNRAIHQAKVVVELHTELLGIPKKG